MLYYNIPHEMQQRINWCCWRYEQADSLAKPTKIPYNPVTGFKMKPNDPQTWCSFEQATEAAKDWSRWAGIGYVFSERDPYFGIDLDNPYAVNDDGSLKFAPEKAAEIAARQVAIAQAFNTYTERSPSGTGLHIIGKGKVPQGRKRDAVEIYSERRFFTFTGNVVHNVPIAERQALATQLWEELAPMRNTDNGKFVSQLSQSHEDQYIFEQASAAANGDKFNALFVGNWQQYYSSQSEADFALIDILAFYTQHIPQIIRMFKTSVLGQRKKAERMDYISKMIDRSFDNQPEPFDIEFVMDDLNRAIAEFEQGKAVAGSTLPGTGSGEVGNQGAGGFDRLLPAPAAPTGPHKPAPEYMRTPDHWPRDTWRKTPPPGILGSIVAYGMAASPLPVYEISLVAAIGLLSGIAGRQFNISKTGLNHYIMMIAGTGRGKDAIASITSKIVSDISSIRMPSATKIIGPTRISSGQALIRYLAGDIGSPCFMSLVGEFGIKLKQITSATASASDETLLSVLLDMYSKSGEGMTISASAYADKMNNTAPVDAPAFTLVGESTGERFYEALDESAVKSGLLPRFIIIDYEGERVPFNYNHANVPVPVTLTQPLENLLIDVYDKATRNSVHHIPIDDDANRMLIMLEEFTRAFINKSHTGDFEHELWNRVHLKTLKLAGLLAVSLDWKNPHVDVKMVEWAASLILHDTYKILDRFDKGKMGVTNESIEQEQTVKDQLRKYITGEFIALKGMDENLRNAKIIARSTLQQRCINRKGFRAARNATYAFNNLIDNLIKNGQLARVTEAQLKPLTNKSGYHVIVIDPDWLFQDTLP